MSNFTKEQALWLIQIHIIMYETTLDCEQFEFFINRVTTGNFTKEQFVDFVDKFFKRIKENKDKQKL